jgi:hypothetical protein
VPGYETFWTNTRSALKSEYHSLIGQFPDVDAQLKKLFNLLGDIEGVPAYTPASVGDSEQRSAIVNSADENRQHLCKSLSRKVLFSALYGTYILALYELKAVLKASTLASQSKTPKSAATQEDDFKEVRRRKRHSTDETAPTSKKAVPTALSDAVDTPRRWSSPVISCPPQGSRLGHGILPVRRPRHKKRQFRGKEEGRPQ